MQKIILSADSTCDIGPDLASRFSVHLFPYHIQIGDKSYIDGIEITAEDMYQAFRENGTLPKTAAVTPGEYLKYFEDWIQEGYQVIHFNLGSALSSGYQNCLVAAEELGNIFVVDSASLSSGFGLLVAKAGEMIKAGLPAEQIFQKMVKMRHNTSASFVLDTLEFMRAGGRCSAVAAFGANLLKLKPCIGVNNQAGGSMSVQKKYRGGMERVLPDYIADQLQNRQDIDTSRVFITHSGSPEEDILLARAEIARHIPFAELHVTRASGTISAHCGPRTLGVLFMTN